MIIDKQAKREGKQLFQLCMVNGAPDELRVRQVVKHVVEANHRRCPVVLAHFLRLVKLDRSRHTASVESAALLPSDLQAATEQFLKNRYGPRLTTVFAQRPSLIGGMRIQVGSDVYDGSVRAGLAALKASF